MKKNKKKRIKPLELILTITPLVLFIFFILSFFHDWANSLTTKLHFCNHTACIVFSIIWLIFALIGIYYLFSKNKMSFLWIVAYIIVLIVGIILMNMTYCDSKGKMHFNDKNIFSGDSTFSGGYDGEVDEPPCSDSDTGRDYLVRGDITPTTPSISDLCLNEETLIERYCDSELTYTSENINCVDEYGEEYVCDDGRCAVKDVGSGDGDVDETEPETNCGDGIDNDDDQYIDCEDEDCDETCGEFTYSCQHLSEFPSCGGTCPSGEECIAYIHSDSTLNGSWCDCMPVTEKFCGEGDLPFCIDWCKDGDECISDSGGCYCNYDYNYCTETDEPYDFYTWGMCVGIDGLTHKDYCDGEILIEYNCNGADCIEIEQNCTELGMYCVAGACQVELPEF